MMNVSENLGVGINKIVCHRVIIMCRTCIYTTSWFSDLPLYKTSLQCCSNTKIIGISAWEISFLGMFTQLCCISTIKTVELRLSIMVVFIKSVFFCRIGMSTKAVSIFIGGFQLFRREIVKSIRDIVNILLITFLMMIA